ncbi:MAG: hypothetical protein LBJ42_01490 [Holosporales bacterium]|nr:hypothetical protein [Holosporales bacterium]
MNKMADVVMNGGKEARTKKISGWMKIYGVVVALTGTPMGIGTARGAEGNHADMFALDQTSTTALYYRRDSRLPCSHEYIILPTGSPEQFVRRANVVAPNAGATAQDLKRIALDIARGSTVDTNARDAMAALEVMRALIPIITPRVQEIPVEELRCAMQTVYDIARYLNPTLLKTLRCDGIQGEFRGRVWRFTLDACIKPVIAYAWRRRDLRPFEAIPRECLPPGLGIQNMTPSRVPALVRYIRDITVTEMTMSQDACSEYEEYIWEKLQPRAKQTILTEASRITTELIAEGVFPNNEDERNRHVDETRRAILEKLVHNGLENVNVAVSLELQMVNRCSDQNEMLQTGQYVEDITRLLFRRIRPLPADDNRCDPECMPPEFFRQHTARLK